MAIEDFGEKISGAAKDRWTDFKTRMKASAGASSIASMPLSESFPEPPYKTLLKDGVDPEVIAFVRAARDLIPTKPKQNYKLQRWVMQVEVLRDFCSDVIDQSLSIDQVKDKLQAPEYKALSAKLSAGMDLYLALGHARSLKGIVLKECKFSYLNNVNHDPPITKWAILKGGSHGKIIASADTRQDAILAFKDKIDDLDTKKKPKIEIYRFRNNPDKGFVIGHKIGRTILDIEAHSTLESAKDRYLNHLGELEEKLKLIKDTPPERSRENIPRTGPGSLQRNISVKEFAETFGFRGVQFGNYVESSRRQEDLNRTYDALMDLSAILNCPPTALSLDGDLGLAFGARGKGGKGAAAAHYEPVQRVINLTKTNGAGSLAHEFFHALDNHFARISGKSPEAYASQSRWSSNPFFETLNEIKTQTDIAQRSDQLDKVRSSPYFGTSIEIAARSFEAYVVHALERVGVQNDYLANFTSEDVFEAEAALRGQPADRYPYPKSGEMDIVTASFERLFSHPEITSMLSISETLQVPEGARCNRFETEDGRDVGFGIQHYDPEHQNDPSPGSDLEDENPPEWDQEKTGQFTMGF